MFDWNKVKFANPKVTFSGQNEAHLGPDLIIYQIIFEANNQLLSFDKMIILLADMNHEINEVLQKAKKYNMSVYLEITSVEIFNQNTDFYLKIHTFPGQTAEALEKLKHYFSLPPIVSNIPKVNKPKRIISDKDIDDFVPSKEKIMLTLSCDRDVTEYLKKVNRNRKLGLVLTYYPKQSLLEITPPVNSVWTMVDLNSAAEKLKLPSQEYSAQQRLLKWNTCTSPSSSFASKSTELQKVGSKRKYQHSMFEDTEKNKILRKNNENSDLSKINSSSSANQFILKPYFLSYVRSQENLPVISQENNNKIVIVSSLNSLNTVSSKLDQSSSTNFSEQFDNSQIEIFEFASSNK